MSSLLESGSSPDAVAGEMAGTEIGSAVTTEARRLTQECDAQPGEDGATTRVGPGASDAAFSAIEQTLALADAAEQEALQAVQEQSARALQATQDAVQQALDLMAGNGGSNAAARAVAQTEQEVAGILAAMSGQVSADIGMIEQVMRRSQEEQQRAVQAAQEQALRAVAATMPVEPQG